MYSTRHYINKLEDFLSTINPSPKIDTRSVADWYEGKTILITGAGGTIGSKLSQIILDSFSGNKVIALDNSESSIFTLQNDLSTSSYNSNVIEFVVGDIRDELKMDHIFQAYKPDVVFHTAAYKQLPLMEDNTYEVIKTNITATKYLADLSLRYKVLKFIFLSTDKAVEPTSIMGATKRICELYIDSLGNDFGAAFQAIRFGNIIGSNGSVIPLFIDKIVKGLPIEVTNENTCRYFINTEAISELLLYIAAQNDYTHNAALINMGKPIEVVNIAKELLRMLDKNNPIVFTKLRKGEKLNEQLSSEDEIIHSTENKSVFEIETTETVNGLQSKMEKLNQVKPSDSKEKIISLIQQILPKFGI